MNIKEDNRPLPLLREETKAFWEGAKNHKLLIQHCNSCGQLIYFPRILCHNCLSTDVGWIETKGRGTLYSYTIIRQSSDPAFQPYVPYVYAIIELDEGVRMITNIVCDDLSSLAIGKDVQVTFDDVNDEITIPRFKLV